MAPHLSCRRLAYPAPAELPAPNWVVVTFELRVPIPASSLIFTLVGRAGSGHEAGWKTGVAPGKARGGMLLKALVSSGAYPTQKTHHKTRIKSSKVPR